MSRLLLVRLLGEDRAEWLAEDATAVGSGTLAECAQAAAGERVTLIAPATAVTLQRATLPGRNRNTQQRAAAYALEEGLAEDVDTLHLAFGATNAHGTAVAVVARAALQGWLERLAAAGITPHAVVAAPLAQPDPEPGCWNIVISDDHALVRCGRETGFGVPSAQLHALLPLALAQAGPGAPTQLRVWADGEVALAPDDIAVVRAGMQHPLQLAMQGCRDSVPMNLLQGPYSPRAHIGRWLRPWRAAAAVLAVWLATEVVAVGVDLHRLQSERDRLDGEMVELWQQARPGTTRLDNPRGRLESELAAARRAQGQGPGGFLPLLGHAAEVLAGSPEISVRALRFRERQLDLELSGGSLEQLDQLRGRFSADSSVDAELTTSRRDDQIDTRLQLRMAQQ